jgi:dipeptidyl aminopeptidase/acylaminoacyl peptidase
MVVRARSFTPEVLLSAPRRGPAVPNHDGTLALYSVSTYSFKDHEEIKEIRILDIKTGSSTLFTNDSEAHDATWLGDGTNAIIWLQSGAKGITSIMVGDGDEPEKASYTADVILAPFENLKLAPLEDGTIACAMTGLATPEGSLYNEETAEKPKSSARIYDKLAVRYWNKYIIPQRSVIWYSKLAKKDGKYSLAVPVHNALKGTDFECPFDSGTGDGANDFDISPTGILFSSWHRSEDPNIAHPRIYYVPLSTFEEEKAPTARGIATGSYKGFTANPRFSPCGKKAALMVTPTTTRFFEQRIMVVSDLSASLHAENVFNDEEASKWDIYPSGFEWGRDGKSLNMVADDCGRVKLFNLPLHLSTTYHRQHHELAESKALTHDGTIVGYFPLGKSNDRLLVSSTSLIDNSTYSILSSSEPENKITLSSASKNGSKLGLKPSQVSEFYFEGAGDYCVQAWLIKPSFFNPHKTYPLALLIHGGPQDGWREAWSTRWNPAVWAEQGYVVVCPNITGSTGFGLEFTMGINGQWGGRPYEDLENCFEYIKKNMSFVDTDNAIAAGGSYGGYMANWIQGNPFGRKFKAIVCHDGVFGTSPFHHPLPFPLF